MLFRSPAASPPHNKRRRGEWRLRIRDPPRPAPPLDPLHLLLTAPATGMAAAAPRGAEGHRRSTDEPSSSEEDAMTTGSRRAPSGAALARRGSPEPMNRGGGWGGGRWGDGVPEETPEAPCRTAARARCHLPLKQGVGVGALHAGSKTDDAGRRGDEGECLLLIHHGAQRHRGIAMRAAARASGYGILCRRRRREPPCRWRRGWRRRPGGCGCGAMHHRGARIGHKPWVEPLVH